MAVMVAAVEEEGRLGTVLDGAARKNRAVLAAARSLKTGHVIASEHLRTGLDRQSAGGRRRLEVRGLARLRHAAFDAVGGGAALDDAPDALEHVFVDLLRRAAGLALHEGVHGRDVPALARHEPADGDARVALAVARNALHHHGGGRRGHERAPALFGIRTRMRGHARELDVDLGRGQEALLHDGRLADPAVAAHMGAEEPVEIVHDACGGHGRRAARSLFGGLEDEAQAPLELVLVIRDPMSERHARRRMGVMAAGVHVARDLGVKPFGRGQVRGVVKLLDEHAVHVEAKARDGAFAARVKVGREPRVAARGLEEGFRHAVFGRSDHRLLDKLRIAAHDGLGPDHVQPHADRPAERLKRAEDLPLGLEFGPALFGAAVDFTAKPRHLLDVPGAVLHVVLLDCKEPKSREIHTNSFPCL